MNKFKIGDIVTATKTGYTTSPHYVVGFTDSVIILSKKADDNVTSGESFDGNWQIELVRTKSEPEVEKVTPETIVVGKRYTHKHQPGRVWLGCGKRKPYASREFTEKFLVLVEDPGDYYLGFIYKTENDVNSCKFGDWDNFELVD